MRSFIVSQSAVRWCWVAILVIILDQISKALVLHFLQLGQSVPLLPVFNIVLWYNTGAAWNFLEQITWAGWLFGGFAVVISILIITWLLRLPGTNRWTAVALNLILGGALGNLIDRIHHGFVVDFIQVYYHQWYYPAFNIADSAITVGAVMLGIEILFFKKKAEVV